MTTEEIWSQYQKINPNAEKYEAWSYGFAPDQLLELTLQGIKTATASCYALYEIEKEPIPKVGDYSILLDSHQEAHCVIQTTKVNVVKFREVPEEQGYLEGEGDRTLQYWREVHKECFTKELREYGIEFQEDILVVCEVFQIVYQPE